MTPKRDKERDHLFQQPQERPASLCVQFLGRECAIAVGISSLKPLLDNGEVFVLGQRTFLINIRSRKFSRTQSASQFAPVDSPIVINVEPIEQGCGCLLGLIEIHCAVFVGVESLQRIGTLGLR